LAFFLLVSLGPKGWKQHPHRPNMIMWLIKWRKGPKIAQKPTNYLFYFLKRNSILFSSEKIKIKNILAIIYRPRAHIPDRCNKNWRKNFFKTFLFCRKYLK
jgi:hypothetical protein